MKRIFCIILAIFLCGCASNPVKKIMFWEAEDLLTISPPLRILLLPSENDSIQPAITKKMSRKMFNEIQRSAAVPLYDLKFSPRDRQTAFENNRDAIIEADKYRGDIPPGTLMLLKPYVSADYIVILEVTEYGQDWAENPKRVPPRILSPRTDFSKETRVGLAGAVYEVSSGHKIMSENFLEKQPNSLHGELFDETEDSAIKTLWKKIYNVILDDLHSRRPELFAKPEKDEK